MSRGSIFHPLAIFLLYINQTPLIYLEVPSCFVVGSLVRRNETLMLPPLYRYDVVIKTVVIVRHCADAVAVWADLHQSLID